MQGHVYDSIFKEAGHQKRSYAEWAHKSEIWDPDTLGGGESLLRRVSEPEKITHMESITGEKLQSNID